MTTTDPIPDKLNITQDDVVRVIRRMIKVDAQPNFVAYFVVGVKSINSVLHLPNVIGRTEIKSV
jgi:hypothetical protein